MLNELIQESKLEHWLLGHCLEQLIKMNIISEGKWTLCNTRCDSLRTHHHLCSIPAENVKPETNNKEIKDKSEMRNILLKYEYHKK